MSSSAQADDPVTAERREWRGRARSNARVYWMPASAGMTTAASATVMSIGRQSEVPHTFWRLLARRDVLAGLMFIGVAALGLWLSRNYPIGTALRMGTGYVPRLLCWILMGLGAIVLVQGLRESSSDRPAEGGALARLWPILIVTA